MESNIFQKKTSYAKTKYLSDISDETLIRSVDSILKIQYYYC